MNDLQLIKRCQNWNLKYFGKLYDRYIDKIYKFVYIKVGDIEISQKITKELFLSVVNNINILDIKDDNNFKIAIYKLISNKIKDFYKSRKEEVLFEDFFDIKSEENIENKEKISNFFNFLFKLKEEQKEIIFLKIWLDISYKEIWEITWKSLEDCKETVFVTLKTININSLNNLLKPSIEFKKDLKKEIDNIIRPVGKKSFNFKLNIIIFILILYFIIFCVYYFFWDKLFTENLNKDGWYIEKVKNKQLEVESISIKEVDDLEKDIFSKELNNKDNLNFLDFCKENKWEIKIVKNDKVCKIWTKECSEETYKKSKCDLIK